MAEARASGADGNIDRLNCSHPKLDCHEGGDVLRFATGPAKHCTTIPSACMKLIDEIFYLGARIPSFLMGCAGVFMSTGSKITV